MTQLTSEFTLPRKYKTDLNGPVRWIASHAVRQWPFLLLALFGAFSNAALGAVAPVIIGQALNTILASPPQIDHLAFLAIILAGSQVLRGLLQFFRNLGFELTAQRLERNIRDEMYTNLLGKSMTFHILQPVGDTMARATNDVREINFLFSPGVNLVVGSLFFLVIPIVISPSYHPALILTPGLFIVFYFLALWRYLKKLKPITDDVRISFGNLNSRLAEALDGIETVKGAVQEQAEMNRFEVSAHRYRKAIIKQGDLESTYLPMLLLSIALGLGLLHSIYLYQLNLLNIGQVVAYFGILLLLDFPTFVSLFAYSQISLGLSSARRILELINRENNLDQNIRGFNGTMKGAVEFANVSFEYDNAPTLKNISFSVKPGQTVAIVGQTGAGKTTLTRLINRTYDASSGQVKLDGIDVREWNLEYLRKNISIIEQDVFLFSKSIMDNISFGKPEATGIEIENAADAAQVTEMASLFSEGFQTMLGERGVTLSGGQRQRIALARAFLTDPRILILDDSTSAIDSATEDRIQKAIFKAAYGRTTFLITHRLSQIRWADLIIVLKKGEIIAMGTHEELLQVSESYRNIFSE